jgi:FkbM family methyltransferase
MNVLALPKKIARKPVKYLIRHGKDAISALSLRDINDMSLISRQEMDWIVRQMRFLDIESCGTTDQGKFAYIRLKNGLVFHNFPTAEWQREIFHKRREFFPANLNEDCLNVAFDIVNRFMRENVGMWIPPLTCQLSMVGPDACLIDVGAYVGYGALRAATLSSQGGKILCLEAEADSVEIMNRMIADNKLSHRMKAVQCALAEQDGEITLHVDRSEGNRQGNIILNAMQDEVSGTNYNLGDQRYSKTSIPARRLDTLLPELNWITPDDPFVMHLGINGSELKALRGMTNVLNDWNRYGIKVSTRYFDPAEGPIHDKVKDLLGSFKGNNVLDIDPHVYAYRWSKV